MGLRSLNIKFSYDSGTDDILNDFYIPVLSSSIEYKRLVGFFSSSSLAIAAKGISSFIINGGQMQLLCSARLTKSDVNEIKKAHKNSQEIIENSILNELENLEDGIAKDHVSALGWMIANKRLEIKIAVLLDEKGFPIEEGILHQKIGVLKDAMGNMISFSGSNNETAFAWKNNIEEFKVFKNWKEHEKEYFNSDSLKFENYWEGKARKVKIIDVPTAVRNKLVKMAPNDINTLNIKRTLNNKVKEKKIHLWDYQKEAIKNWEKNGNKGIFEMATGTGKTFTSLGCLQKTLDNIKKLLTVITCPSQHLLKQWKNEIDKFGIKYDLVIVADSSNRSWKNQFADALIDISLGYKGHIIVLTTHRSFSSYDFKLILKNNLDDFTCLLIADEVHGLGAEVSTEGLIDEYQLRLGLSATPERWFDYSGTEIIHDYFGGVVYQFSLDKAINTINPATKETYLTPYRYILKFVSLSEDELDKYVDYSKKIALQYYKVKDKEKSKLYDKLLFMRANIIKNAEDKFKILEEILEEIESIEGIIIYCSSEQIDGIMKIINKKRIKTHRFTMGEGVKPLKNLKGASERDYILNKFTEGYYKILVAMKCLDEGVDIPPAQIGVMMASSGNPREYIQRIGRLIRRYPNKKQAIIYDIVVKPSIKKLPKELRGIEHKIFEKEIQRCEEIAKIAINSSEALNILYGMGE